MWKKILRPYASVVTLVVFVIIGVLSVIRINFHFLDPFSNGIKDYDVTDIVFSRFRSKQAVIDDRIVIVNVGQEGRATLAAMLARIAAAKPKAVGVDVFFSEKKAGPADSMLQAVLKRTGNVVTSSKLINYREDRQEFDPEAGVDTFFSNYVRTGYANFPSANSKTIRFFSPTENTIKGPAYSFAVQVVRQYEPAAAEQLLARRKRLERIHYTSDENNFLQFESTQILDTQIDLRPLLEDKIVLLGYNDPYNEECPMLDKHYTPINQQYSGRTEPDMYGVVIHANIIQMMLDRQYIFTMPGWLSILLALVYCYLNILLLEEIHERYPRLYYPIIRVLQVLEFTFLFFLLSILFYYFRIKWDFSVGMLALALYFDVVLSYESILNNQRPWIEKLPKLFDKEEEE